MLNNITFDVRNTVCDGLEVDVCIHCNNGEVHEFPLAKLLSRNKRKKYPGTAFLNFNFEKWDEFLSDYLQNKSKKRNPTSGLPFGYNGYYFKFCTTIRHRHYITKSFVIRVDEQDKIKIIEEIQNLIYKINGCLLNKESG